MPCDAFALQGTDPHVENFKYPRGNGKFSTLRRNKTSEESNETSEESFLPHVENKKYPRGDLMFPTWISIFRRCRSKVHE